QGNSKNYHVFIIPVDEELNLKAAAKAVSEKKIEMIAVKDITKVSGYIRGGCSPVGMKKLFPTCIDESAQSLETMIVSGGKIGIQIELKVD
ncbi:YbaK/EbsC family protein, partial [Planococcus sp. SIMBA_160]